ncbi:hypothetical protein PUNSTDRAFT_68439, partial [Punctularia strigosozonata HHB-11173 SS5]|uniref:uncharacterized protein n=1 Tax=Punctularia strigosozonata (strain HHB-11173) TaxID=741275 RepID=UPI000441687D
LKALAAYGGLELTAPEFEYGKDNKTPEFLAKFPLGKIPAFEGADGFQLFELIAIARYIASQSPQADLILGSDIVTKAQVDQWISFAQKEILAPLINIHQLCRGIIKPYYKPLHTQQAEAQFRALDVLEKHLVAHTFLVGERITLADIILAGAISFAVQVTLDPPARAKYPSVIRHFETVIRQSQFAPIFGEPKYADKPLAYTPTKTK